MLPVVLLMIAPGVADAQARQAGALVYHNATASRIRVTVTRVTDAAGKEAKDRGVEEGRRRRPTWPTSCFRRPGR